MMHLLILAALALTCVAIRAIPERAVIFEPYEDGLAQYMPHYVLNNTFEWPHPIVQNDSDRKLSLLEAADKFVYMHGTQSFRHLPDRYYVDENGAAHVHFVQTVFGMDIPHREYRVHIASNKSVLSYEKRFNLQPYMSPLKPGEILDPVEALKIAVNTLCLPLNITHDAKAVPEKPLRYVEIDGVRHVRAYKINGTSGGLSRPSLKLHQNSMLGLKYYTASKYESFWVWIISMDIDMSMRDMVVYIDATDSKQILRVRCSGPDIAGLLVGPNRRNKYPDVEE